MPAYTASMVERLLRNYLDIRYTLEGKGQVLPDTYSIRTPPRDMRNAPLGQTPSGQPWPFMDVPRAKAPNDGKRKARLMEELHVSCLDIEAALPRMSDDDLRIIYEYFIFQDKTLDELAAARGLTSRGSMQRYTQRVVDRLTRELNNGPY